LERQPTSGHHSGSSRTFIEQSASSSALKILPVKELTWRRPIGVTCRREAYLPTALRRFIEVIKARAKHMIVPR
jgi:DNA-binding transcriptional LysR family regulator